MPPIPKFFHKKILSNSKLPTTQNAIKDVSGPVLSDEYKKMIASNSTLGEKGYTILKSALTAEDLSFLKKDLYIVPEQSGAKRGLGAESESPFPIYRENENKIYLPRFYGVARYGPPSLSKLAPGDAINLAFSAKLYDFQENIVRIYKEHVDSGLGSGNGGVLQVPCGKGKTVISIKIISLLQKKTLILVHKGFLMKQWIERINTFMPGARIGTIQGPTFDIDDKDVVIGMLQTMYKRDYPPNTFSSFGLTIVDEAHRICSEEFSKVLLRVCTPCMLGVSATVDRKDALERVLFSFVGPRIYQQFRENDEVVYVRGIEFVSADSEFAEVEYDFRGQVKYSTMVSKLCDYGPRKDFIVKILSDLLKEDPDIQIMVLAHNRSLLEYLSEAIQYRGFASCGFYVGGMKEAALKETEEKQIVLATYAMAAEALDIPTLSALILATPRTDIEQSIGRILRSKHETPIVVDILDEHSVFQNQWVKRKQFYRKCGYHITTCKSTEYYGFVESQTKKTVWKSANSRSKPGKKTCETPSMKAVIQEPDDEMGGKCLIPYVNFDD